MFVFETQFILNKQNLCARLNDSAYVQTSYTDMLWMVWAMGMASKESLMKKIPFTVYTWLQSDIERRVVRKSWYKVPVAIMSQLLHPVKSLPTCNTQLSCFVNIYYIMLLLVLLREVG